MPDTERLYAAFDKTSNELAAFDRRVAEAKEQTRATIQWLETVAGIPDDGGRCFTTILEAIDDLVSDKRDDIRGRISEIDEEIERIEWADLQRSSPVGA